MYNKYWFAFLESDMTSLKLLVFCEFNFEKIYLKLLFKIQLSNWVSWVIN